MRNQFRPLWRPLRRAARVLFHAGRARHCPVCGISARKFAPFGEVPRSDARCLHCGSLERHRAVWLYLTRNTDLFNGRSKRVLHMAPEPCFEPLFKRRIGPGYLTADLFEPNVMEKMDLMDIRHHDATFDVIYCSHVLQHVPDDRKAIRELCRVLKPTGWALLQMPLSAEPTFEDASITDPAQRRRVYGHSEYLRRCGSDYAERLRAEGFMVTAPDLATVISPEEIPQMGLSKHLGALYHCTK